MNLKNILIILSLLFLICVSVSAVSATDINTTDNVSSTISVDSFDMNSNLNNDSSLGASSYKISVSNVTGVENTSVKITAKVTNGGKAVSSGKVTFWLWFMESKEYYYASVSNGQASVTIKLPSIGNSSVISKTYRGCEASYNDLVSTKFDVKVISSQSGGNSFISVNDVSGKCEDVVTVTAIIKDIYNNPINGGTVTFNIGGKSYYATVSNGKASTFVTLPSYVTSYSCSASYGGYGSYKSSSTTFKISSHEDYGCEVYLNPITTTYNSNKYFYLGWSGYFDGYFKVYKGSSCVHSEYLYGYDNDLKWELNNLNSVGTYTAKLINIDGIVLGTAQIKITKSSSTVSCKSFTTRVGTKFTCYAYVKDKYSGNNYDGGTVTFIIAGKTYKRTVNNGVAKVTFTVSGKSKKYTCKATFSGGSNVYGSSKTFYMVVKPKLKPLVVTLSTKLNKYCTKSISGYKIQSYKWKASLYQEIDVFVYKNGKFINKNKYHFRYQYKVNGHWKWSSWSHNDIDGSYNKVHIKRNLVIGKVQVKITR